LMFDISGKSLRLRILVCSLSLDLEFIFFKSFMALLRMLIFIL